MNILVIEADPIVTLDLVAILQGRFVDARIDQCATLHHALEKLVSFDGLAAVVVGLQVQDFAASALPSLIEQMNGKIIFAHYGASEAHEDAISRGWIPLSVPFTNESVNEALMNSGLVKH